MELPGDIATWLPFGVTVGAIALAGALALVVLVMRRHTDALLRRIDEKTRATEAEFQREEAIVSAEPGALYVWRANDTTGAPLTRSGAANLLADKLRRDVIRLVVQVREQHGRPCQPAAAGAAAIDTPLDNARTAAAAKS